MVLTYYFGHVLSAFALAMLLSFSYFGEAVTRPDEPHCGDRRDPQSFLPGHV